MLLIQNSQKFSGIWSYFSEAYSEFQKNYDADAGEYSKSIRYTPKSGTPENSFNISMVPWLEFTSCNINVFDDGKFCCPFLQWGSVLRGMGSGFCHLPFRFTTLFATDIMSDCLWRNCKKELMNFKRIDPQIQTEVCCC